MPNLMTVSRFLPSPNKRLTIAQRREEGCLEIRTRVVKTPEQLGNNETTNIMPKKVWAITKFECLKLADMPFYIQKIRS